MCLLVQILNHYIDCVSTGRPVSQHKLQFAVLEVSHISSLEVNLTANGSLAPLFHAFGLISAEDLPTDWTPKASGMDLSILLPCCCQAPCIKQTRIGQWVCKCVIMLQPDGLCGRPKSLLEIAGSLPRHHCHALSIHLSNLHPCWGLGGLAHLQQLLTCCSIAGESDVDFLQWLGSTVAEAAKTAEQHKALRATIEDLTASIRTQFGLAHVLVRRCMPSAVSPAPADCPSSAGLSAGLHCLLCMCLQLCSGAGILLSAESLTYFC